MTAFDTLKAAQSMEAAGIERRHAEAIAAAVAESGEHAATRADLDALESRLHATVYRALLLQAAAIVAAVVALLKLIP